MGAIETQMIDGAYAEIGKHLGLPTHAYLGMSDSKVLDFQSGMESAMGATMAVISGINNISGPGMHDFETCQSFEKLVLDHEIVGLAQRLTRGIEIRDEPIALNLIEEAIDEKDFLSLPHTAKWFRHEAYFPDKVIDRATLGEWEEEGRLDSGMRAHARVADLLAAHETEPLSDDLRAELMEIMMRDAREQGVDELPPLGVDELVPAGL